MQLLSSSQGSTPIASDFDRSCPTTVEKFSSPLIWEGITCQILGSEPSNDMFGKSSCIFIASSCLSVRPSVAPSDRTTRFPPVGFSLNLMFRYFSKIYRENSSFLTMWQEQCVLYMKTDVSWWSFLEWEMFKSMFLGKIKTNILQPKTIFVSKIVPFVR